MADKPKPFKALRKELQAVKARWKGGVKLFWKKPPPPWPVRLSHEVSQPAPYAFDVDDFKVTLIIEGPDMSKLPLRVEIKQTAFPAALCRRIEEEIVTKWKHVISKQLAESTARCWFMERLLEWIDASFGDFLRLVPELVESYMGCSNTGATMRRFTIIPPKVEEEEVVFVAKELTEEQIAKREMVLERREERERVAYAKKMNEAATRKQYAMRMKEKGIDLGGPKVESKKAFNERMAGKKKQGVRLRKTGARATKFAGAGSALEKGLSKKEKKKREEAAK